jgi:DNA adenine methylase
MLRWAGGKRRLLPVILAAMPRTYGRYFEPFIGGGAVMLANAKPGHDCTIGDALPILTNLYRVTRDAPSDLVAAVAKYEGQRSRDEFERIRTQIPVTPVEQAAWLLFISRVGYNGLLRVNQEGICNTSWDEQSTAPIVDIGNVMAVHKRLQGVTILTESFSTTCAQARAGDFVYLDPPRIDMNTASLFDRYSPLRFSFDDHQRLVNLIDDLTSRGVYVMVTNSDSPITRDLYRNLNMRTVNEKNNFLTPAQSGRKHKKILAVNYPIEWMAHPWFLIEHSWIVQPLSVEGG